MQSKQKKFEFLCSFFFTIFYFSDDKSILLDCGEGTHGQIVKHFGLKKSKKLLKKLSAIYISHKHHDHFIGIFGILKARRKAFEEENKEVRFLKFL